MKSSFIGTIIAVVVVIIVVAAVLSYISTHPSTTKPVTTPPVTTPPVTTISYWEAYSPSELSTFNNKILPLFEAQYPNIKVVVTNVALSTSNYETDAAAHKAPNVYYDSSNDEGLLYAV